MCYRQQLGVCAAGNTWRYGDAQLPSNPGAFIQSPRLTAVAFDVFPAGIWADPGFTPFLPM